MERLKRQMNFLIEIDKVKNIFRQSLISDKSRNENDAEHSWHMAMYALILEEYAPKGTDILKVIKMALIHDIVEIYAGGSLQNLKKKEKKKQQKKYILYYQMNKVGK